MQKTYLNLYAQKILSVDRPTRGHLQFWFYAIKLLHNQKLHGQSKQQEKEKSNI